MHSISMPELPKNSTFSFLHPGWWVLHAAAIIIVLTIGYCLCDD